MGVMHLYICVLHIIYTDICTNSYVYVASEVVCVFFLKLVGVLQVSSIRESRSDDKRFSIFTGTKRLHMRAETQEDRRQ